MPARHQLERAVDNLHARNGQNRRFAAVSEMNDKQLALIRANASRATEAAYAALYRAAYLVEVSRVMELGDVALGSLAAARAEVNGIMNPVGEV